MKKKKDTCETAVNWYDSIENCGLSGYFAPFWLNGGDLTHFLSIQTLRIREHIFFFSRRRRHTRFDCDWSSDVCSSDLAKAIELEPHRLRAFAAGTAEADVAVRSEERRVGKERRARWSPYQQQKKRS